MAERSESLLALLPPVIALTWVISDAALGLVAAEKSVATAPLPVHIVGANQSTVAVETKPSRATVAICSPDGEIAAGIVQKGGSRETLQRLCRARSKFTSRVKSDQERTENCCSGFRSASSAALAPGESSSSIFNNV